MLRNYLLVATRDLARQKVYAAVTIGGLAVGVAACALLGLYVRHELSYDRFHEGAERIYRVVVKMRSQEMELSAPVAPSAMAAAIREQIPEVEAVGRLWKPREATQALRVGQEAYYEEQFYWADPELAEVLGIEAVAGDVRAALADPKGVVLTVETARRYFGDAPALGRILDGGERVVGAVVADPPSNTHLPYAVLAASSGTNVDQRPFPGSWFDHSYCTYLRLRDGADPDRVAAQLDAIVQERMGATYEGLGHEVAYRLQPVTDIHLHSSDLYYDIGHGGDVVHVVAFAIIGGFLLVLAVINFANLATARSAERAAEVGLRKAVGAHRVQLVRQFLGEAVALSLLCLVPAVALMHLARPALIALTGTDLEVRLPGDPTLAAALLSMALAAGLGGGLYPALRLAAFVPQHGLRGRAGRQGGAGLRQALVVFQFVVSIGLIGATVTIEEQLDYLRSKALGFDEAHLVVVSTRSDEIRLNFEPVRRDLLASPLITAVGRCSQEPGYVANKSVIRPRGAPEGTSLEVTMVWVDHDFSEAMGLRVVAGRSFSNEREGDARHACLVNEALACLLADSSAVGTELVDPEDETDTAEVVGVVADFHFQSMHRPVEPLVLLLPQNVVNSGDAPRHAVVRLGPGDPRAGIEHIRQTLRDHGDPLPMDYHFVDERMDGLYAREEAMGRLLAAFAGVAVFIACLGLFGLTAFTTQRRTREIGIRKVLGATAASVVVLLSRDLLRLILVASVIAWPLIYVAMQRWLQGFAYRVDPGVAACGIAGGLALAVAGLTVSHHALRAAHANPVDALRNE